ncbi:hypothetical protein XENORESO_020351 [Xenotaenia resolanae]|uniref:Uncharacterized protein n=1 Tax=Xenotaenia resolanae TaxID=208358 RepID=A0ABV0VXV5_9TELE
MMCLTFSKVTLPSRKEEATITAQNGVTYLLLIVPRLWVRRNAHSGVCLSFLSRSASTVSFTDTIAARHPSPPPRSPLAASLTPHPAISSFTKPLINPSLFPLH